MFSSTSLIFTKNKYSLFGWFWLIFVSAFTVVKVAPSELNADTILQSVMSLQNVTLYYWGQNRLLNILPFITSLISDPSTNLASILFLTSLSFYGFLYLLSYLLSAILDVKDSNSIATKVFVIFTVAFIFIFKTHAIYEIAIGQIAYSLSALLLISASLIFYSKKLAAICKPYLIIGFLMLILAIGLNPSALILGFFITLVTASYRKKLNLNDLFFLSVNAISFFSWNLISRRYGNFGNFPYNKFTIETALSGFDKSFGAIINTLNLPIIFSLIFIACAIFASHIILVKKVNTTNNSRLISYMTLSAIVFAIGWLVLFSSNKWVEMNGFAWRYYIYSIFAIFLIVIIHLTSFISKINRKLSSSITVVTSFFGIYYLYSPVVKFSDYKIFKNADDLTNRGSHFYAGDYWIVWPSVMRDMMSGYESYGLAYRAHSNCNNVTSTAFQKIKDFGYIEVFCLRAESSQCIEQVKSVVPLFVSKIQPSINGVQKIIFHDKLPAINSAQKLSVKHSNQSGLCLLNTNYSNKDLILNYSFAKSENPISKGIFEVKGLSHPEVFGRWSDGERVEIILDKSLPKGNVLLSINGHAYGPNIGKQIEFIVGNDKKIAIFDKESSTVNIEYSINDECYNTIIINIPNPISPAELGESLDTRKIGLWLSSFKIYHKK
jgi:hypothetical protein